MIIIISVIDAYDIITIINLPAFPGDYELMCSCTFDVMCIFVYVVFMYVISNKNLIKIVLHNCVISELKKNLR